LHRNIRLLIGRTDSTSALKNPPLPNLHSWAMRSPARAGMVLTARSKVVMADRRRAEYRCRESKERTFEAVDMATGSVRSILLCGLLLATAQFAFAQPPAAREGDAQNAAVAHDGQHDFDFEFGDWKMHLSRRVKPLTGSNTWVSYDGTSIVRKVWNGAANLGEIELTGPAGRIQGLSLRVYNPESRQWNVHFANSSSGVLGEAMVGGFKNGRGEFYNQELYNGKSIFVRFIFSDIGPSSFKLEQAFSDDGGKTWEANWLATFTR
jgi:hypothetical protein